MGGVRHERVLLGWLVGVAFALFALVAGGCDGSSGGSVGGSLSEEVSGGGSEPGESASSEGAESSPPSGDERAGMTDRGIAEPTRVLVRVLDRSGMFADGQRPTLYLASSDSGWDPAGLASDGGWSERAPGEGGRAGQETGGGWSFFLPSETIRRDGFSFKFTRGGWDTVEVDSAGRDVPNRTLDESEWSSLRRVEAEGEGVAVLDLVLEGFADQRGTRWSMGEDRAARESSVVGDLRIHEVRARALGPMPRTVRVWLPAGYDDPANADRRYPVLYMHDGQNLFDAATAGFGMEWRVDETMSSLIESGKVEPWIVVGIDHGGERRVSELTLDGVEVNGETGIGNRYLSFLVDELIPWVEGEYRVLEGAEHRALGGSSCGGNITIQAMFDRPGVFSRVLIESPALWIGDLVLVRRIGRHAGVLPDRMFVGMGNREYGDAQRDAALVEASESLRDAIEERIDAGAAGVSGDSAPVLRFRVVEDGRHNEDAWAERLAWTLEFLLGPEGE